MNGSISVWFKAVFRGPSLAFIRLFNAELPPSSARSRFHMTIHDGSVDRDEGLFGLCAPLHNLCM